MAERRHFWDDWTDEQVARHFRYYTPEQLTAWVQASGLDITCTDEDTLRAAAAIQYAATARVAAARPDNAEPASAASAGGSASVNRMDTLPPPRPRPARSRVRRPAASSASRIT